jgi:hypothetical protein
VCFSLIWSAVEELDDWLYKVVLGQALSKAEVELPKGLKVEKNCYLYI